MSGGAMNYAYTQIEYECVGQMGDHELDDLMADVAKLVHDREWNLSGDTCDETYAQSVREFKQKWFETPRKDRLRSYIVEICDKAFSECFAMIGEKDAMHHIQFVTPQHELINKYGEYVDKTVAASILGVTRMTVYKLIDKGCIRTGYNGKRVSVQSIIEYMEGEGR